MCRRQYSEIYEVSGSIVVSTYVSVQREPKPCEIRSETFEICSSPGSTDPFHLDDLSLEVQIESFKYTRYIQGIQAGLPQIFHLRINH